MPLHCAVVRNGILNVSEPMPVEAEGGRLVVFKEKLYCFYLKSPTRVFYVAKARTGSWSPPEDVGIESRSGLPAVFVFDDKLHVYSSGVDGDAQTYPGTGARLAVFKPSNRTFDITTPDAAYGSPSVVACNGKAYKFARFNSGGRLSVRDSNDGITWWARDWIYPRGEGSAIIESTSDPVACLYQGLIHVFHQAPDGLCLIRYDGQSGWSRSQPLIEKVYPAMPAVAVHDGMLTLAFANATNALDNTLSVNGIPSEAAMGDDTAEGTIDLYRYDGNALSKVDQSININASGAPDSVVFEGELHLVFAAV